MGPSQSLCGSKERVSNLLSLNPFGLMLQSTTDRVAYKAQTFLPPLTIREAGKWKIMTLADLASGKNPLRYNLTWQKGPRSSVGSLYKNTNPIHEGSALTT